MATELNITNRERHITKLTAADLWYPGHRVVRVTRTDEFNVEYELRTPANDPVTLEVSDLGGRFTVHY